MTLKDKLRLSKMRNWSIDLLLRETYVTSAAVLVNFTDYLLGQESDSESKFLTLPQNWQKKLEFDLTGISTVKRTFLML